MKAVVQRVRDALVSVDGKTVGSIRRGLLVYLGVGKDDTEADSSWLAEKIPGLRIFEDEDGRMNLSLMDVSGGILVVSQFTLYGDARKGRRPSYGDAADPATGEALYEHFTSLVGGIVSETARGVFGADMDVAYVNEGPVTILLDTRQ